MFLSKLCKEEKKQLLDLQVFQHFHIQDDCNVCFTMPVQGCLSIAVQQVRHVGLCFEYKGRLLIAEALEHFTVAVAKASV